MTTSLKGYLFQTQDGEWILSDEPDLKSCCVGSLAKREHQIFLEGNFEGFPKGRPLELTGVMSVEGGRRYLREAKIIEKGRTFPLFSTIALVVCVLGIYLLKRLRKN